MTKVDYVSAVLLTLCIAATSCSSAASKKVVDDSKAIGVARLQGYGTIVLELFSDANGNPVHGLFSYKPGDPKYEKIKKHVGDIRVGEEKDVRPFPEEKR